MIYEVWVSIWEGQKHKLLGKNQLYINLSEIMGTRK